MNTVVSPESRSFSLVPRDLDECRLLLRSHPEAALLAGATAAQLSWPSATMPASSLDLQILMQQARAQPLQMIERRIDPMQGGESAIPQLELPALRSLESLRVEPLLKTLFPAVTGLIGQIGSAAVRRLGTLGGNLCWPAGDLSAAMLALEANYVFLNQGEVPAAAAPLLPPGDLLVAVRLPAPDRKRLVIVEKVGFRAAFSPSLVTLAICIEEGATQALMRQPVVESDGASGSESGAPACRLAVGGGTNKAQRLLRTEALLQSRPAPGRRQVIEQIRAEMQSRDDALASACERIEVAARCIVGHLENAGMLNVREDIGMLGNRESN